MSTSHKTSTPNRLAHETSPYLLQHAYNPVDWYPWGEEALQKAQTEDKPILVSIGYSACHWCHVMERECFESEKIAQVMNEHYVCIKVDREERPDVDAIYMDALHAMGVQGGWPLNVFLTPDAKPFYGGTYFPPQHWTSLLSQISAAYRQQRDKIVESAESFTEHLGVTDSQKYQLHGGEDRYTRDELEQLYGKLSAQFDTQRGGMRKERNKFPMPSIYLFLLRYWQITQNEAALKQICFTLDRMALGGIYDQAGGGFARYSTDPEWFAPHFEKMLYDNGQLVSLYSEAYAATKDPLYEQVVYQSIDFIERELTSPEGGFYSALDADSEGVEGKFYVWTLAELDAILGKSQESEWLYAYYGITEEGNWEHDMNILHATVRPEVFAAQRNISVDDFLKTLADAKQKLLDARKSRIRPGLDDKILCSWNGLMLKGVVDAYRVFGEEKFLNIALRNASFLKEKMRDGQRLWHSYKNGKATLPGYLEDYAFVIDAYTALYQATSDEEWLAQAQQLANYTLKNFYDAQEQLFFFTDATAEKLIVRKKELFDNVIPASNSAMARNLYTLGLLLNESTYEQTAAQMLSKVKKLVLTDVQYLSNWACLFAARVQPTAEIVIIGPDADTFRQKIEQTYYPNKVLISSPIANDDSIAPLLEGRYAIGEQTTIYVCFNKACRLPVYTVAEAWKQLGGFSIEEDTVF
jgi:uncharacterized protein YyaL (SSP411 family)